MNQDIRDVQKWQTLDGDELARTVFSTVTRIRNNQGGFWLRNMTYAQLYENLDAFINYGSLNYLLPNYGQNITTAQVNNSAGVTYNTIKSNIDTAVAKIGKNKPRVRFITSGGDYKLQKKAKLLTKFLDGVFYKTNIYKYAAQVVKSGCIWGTGALKVCIEPNTENIVVEQVPPFDLVVDYMDGKNRQPKQIHHIRVVAKDILLSTYKDADQDLLDKIKSVPTLPNPSGYLDDQVIVIESWHLPNAATCPKGKHTISLSTLCLSEEDYEKDYLPFVFWRWTDRSDYGFWGYGLTEELMYIQLAINKLHKIIQAGQEMNAIPQVWVTAGSLINKRSIYEAGVQEMSAGSNPPIFTQHPASTADNYQFLDKLDQKSYQISGIGMTQSVGEKPKGLTSGVAQREFQDINAERLAIQGSNYEQLFLDAARIMIDLGRDLYKKNKNFKVKSVNKKFLQSISWKDCNLDDDDFEMQCFPVSKLPTTPEGKLDFLTELMQANLITKDQFTELMEMPDIENWFSLTNSTYNLVIEDLDAMAENGESRQPDPLMKLTFAQIIAQTYYLESRVNKVEEDNLELIRDYLNNIKGLIEKSQAPAPAAPPPENPMAAPIGPPSSDLLPVGQ